MASGIFLDKVVDKVANATNTGIGISTSNISKIHTKITKKHRKYIPPGRHTLRSNPHNEKGMGGLSLQGVGFGGLSSTQTPGRI